jgi:hypothetical protein
VDQASAAAQPAAREQAAPADVPVAAPAVAVPGMLPVAAKLRALPEATMTVTAAPGAG